MKRAVRKLPLFAPASRAAFECTSCGACCSAGWGIAVDRVTWKRLADLLARRDHPKPFDAAATMTVRERPTDLEDAMLRQVDSACVFLDDDRLCYIHKHFGAEAKPVGCRSFPSKAATTSPAGRHLAPSFGCSGMIGALKRTAGNLALVRDPAGVEWTPGQATTRLGESDFTAFDPERRSGVTAGGFDALMLGLREVLALPGPSVAARVMAARLWLGDLARGDAWLGPQEVRANLDALLSDGGATLRECVPAVLHPDANVPMRVLQMILHRRLAMGPLKAESVGWWKTVVDRYRFADESASGSAALFGEDRAARLDPVAADLEPLWVSYIADKLFYSSEYFRVGVLAGFHAVLCLQALIRLFAVADAASREAPVDQGTLLRAIEMVELQFSHATQLFDFWSAGGNGETLKLPFAAALLAG
ncbi:MAG: YkgJ family cysteine cluster protein [Myxococcales bacterium]|nr:YkgJ family cysteine cluster protein [Myxococcales bacterium]